MSDARWSDPREYDPRDPGDECARVYDPRDRDEQDPRDGLMRDLDLPRGDARELVVNRDRVYELDGEDSRGLAAVGAFRIVAERDLDLPHDTLESLRHQRLVELVDLGDGERGLTLTTDGRSLLDSHSLERDRDPNAFTGVVVVEPGILGPRDGAVAINLVTPGGGGVAFEGTIIQQHVFARGSRPSVVITIGVLESL